jgi:hypothetical protein
MKIGRYVRTPAGERGLMADARTAAQLAHDHLGDVKTLDARLKTIRTRTRKPAATRPSSAATSGPCDAYACLPTALVTGSCSMSNQSPRPRRFCP